MSDRVHRLLEPVFRTHHHLVTPALASEVGVHRNELARLLRTLELEPVEPRVYRRADAPSSWEGRLLAIILSRRTPAVASHRAGARLLEVDTYERAPLELTVPSKRGFSHPEAIIHESRDLPYIPPVEIAGIPCTPPRRLAVDIGAVVGETAYATVIRQLRRDHGVSLKQLAAVLALHSRHGRDGCGPLRHYLERYYGVDGIPDTTLEQTALDLILDHHLPVPLCQFVVELPGGGYYRLDFAYPDIRLAVEIDGPHHRLPEVIARDLRRDTRLRALGWEVLRLPEEVVVYTPAAAVVRLRRALVDLGGL